jgi:hypothetical protein
MLTEIAVIKKKKRVNQSKSRKNKADGNSKNSKGKKVATAA